ncbi:hypothetical protein [uncultured Paludibaculum sp.]|uniref:hypothetical protein n=1 Tax=uncultured Paludibaculum sp. TaxID=1765020 RepID=UPI002AAAF57B|nr:hypothetical protein [uncultured Paludibaculum sp.]
MNKTIYLRDEEGPIWDRARELAGDKLSPVVVNALKRFINESEAKAKGFERIEVSFNDYDDHRIPKIKAFYGRWVFPPNKAIELTNEEGTTSSRYAVAITAKGAAVVYSWKEDEESTWGNSLRVFNSLEHAAADVEVNFAARQAIKELGVRIEELDI